MSIAHHREHRRRRRAFRARQLNPPDPRRHLRLRYLAEVPERSPVKAPARDRHTRRVALATGALSGDDPQLLHRESRHFVRVVLNATASE